MKEMDSLMKERYAEGVVDVSLRNELERLNVLVLVVWASLRPYPLFPSSNNALLKEVNSTFFCK